MSQRNKIKLTFIQETDSNLIIQNPPEELKKRLTFWKKDLVNMGYGKFKTQRTKQKLYDVLEDGKVEKIFTLPGFRRLAGSIMRSRKVFLKYKPVVLDKRRKFHVNHKRAEEFAEKHMRKVQAEVLRKCVKIQENFTVSLPTRWGKTRLIAGLLEAYHGYRCVLAVPGIDLIKQMADDLGVLTPERDIKILYGGNVKSTQGNDITICSMDSIDKLNPDNVDVFIADEVHTSVSEGRAPDIATLHRARRIGLGATLTGRYDNSDILIEGLFGPTLVEKTFREAVEEGSICDIQVMIVPFYFEKANDRNRRQAYNRIVYKNPGFVEMIKILADSLIPQDWQTLFYISTEQQGRLLEKAIENGSLAMAKVFKNEKQRKAYFEEMAAGNIHRSICSRIYGQGTTFPDLRVIVNCEGGGGSISSTQKPGRLAQIRPGKSCGYVVDFMFLPQDIMEEEDMGEEWYGVYVDSLNRIKTYKEKGYAVKTLKQIEDVRFD